jgi:cytochrome c oxidase subunit II
MFSTLSNVIMLPAQATEFSVHYDRFFWYITAVITCGALVVFAGLLYQCFAFARQSPEDRTPRILGSTKIEIVWTVIPALFFLSFFVWGVKIYNAKITIPNDAPEYFVAGKQWMWKMQHPDGQREINELHIAVDVPIKMTGTSEDVIHDFGIPAFRDKFDVVPGRYVSTWYHPIQVGTYNIFCDQYCGQGHSVMIGKVHVMEQGDYAKWKEGTIRTKMGQGHVDGSAAWEGRKLFLKMQCNACHNPNESARAPRLEEMYDKIRPIQGGTQQRFDEEYIRKSIRNPMAQVAEGWKPIMPAYPVSQLDEIEFRNLVAYIKSLKLGDLPSRTEYAPAPQGAPVVSSEGGN